MNCTKSLLKANHPTWSFQFTRQGSHTPLKKRGLLDKKWKPPPPPSTWISETVVPVFHEDQQFSSVPDYPPLFKTSRLGRQRYNRQRWYDSIERMPSVEEKLVEILKGFYGEAKPRRIVILDAFTEHYSTLAFRQNCTKTRLVHGLPPCAAYSHPSVDAVAAKIKPIVLDAIRHCFTDSAPLEPKDVVDTFTDIRRDRLNGQRMINHVVRAITMAAGVEYGNHLLQCQMDLAPRCDSFWAKGGYPPEIGLQHTRKNMLKKCPDRAQPNDPVDIWFQYIGNPYLQIRNELPLPNFVDQEDPLCREIEVPEFPFDPRTLGYVYKERHGTQVPGVWPLDPMKFGNLSFHTRELGLRNLRRYGQESLKDALCGFGVLASFSWLVGLAANNGFTPYHEITYPMSTQTVITDGRQWSFFAYQMNTLAIGQDFDEPVNPMETPKVPIQNLCWATDERSLFEAVDKDQVIGFDDSVLKTIVGFVLNKPRDEVDFELRPYLRDHKYTDIEWMLIFLELRHLFANKPKSNRIPETPLYKKIYKFKFQKKIE